MKAKIIIVGLIEEKLVATFSHFADANIAAVMLQATTTEESNLRYYVEYKGTRRLAGSLAQHLPYINAGEKNNCKLYFNS